MDIDLWFKLLDRAEKVVEIVDITNLPGPQRFELLKLKEVIHRIKAQVK